MSTKDLLSKALSGSAEKPAEPKVDFFTLTSKTIRYGHGSEVYPLKQVARFGKFKITESKIPLIVVIGLGIFGLYLLTHLSLSNVFFALPALAIAGYGIWQRLQPGRFALGIETASGSSRYLVSTDEAFIDEVLELMTRYIEEETVGNTRIVNFVDRSIRIKGNNFGTASTNDEVGDKEPVTP